MSKVKYSKLKNFRLVTGEHLLDIVQKVGEGTGEEKINALEVLTLGLYLLDAYNVIDARKEYQRLTKEGNDDERYDIIDNVDPAELADDLFG